MDRTSALLALLRKLILIVIGTAFWSIGLNALAKEPAAARPVSPDPRYTVSELLAQDDFDHGLELWKAELEKGGTVVARDGALEIDVPGGCSVWLKTALSGPVLITYDATEVSAGGPNDRVSDLNCFWMARDSRALDDIFGHARNGKFSDYDQLQCYYVGQGGNSNTTTRFRRYVGEKGNRPLRPEHDLSAREFLLVPNVSQTIQLIAAGGVIGYYRDGRQIFSYDDPQPYTSGWFAIRTVTNHLRVKKFRVYRLKLQREAVSTPASASKP